MSDPTTPLLITPEGEVTEFTPENGKTFSLQELQAAVGGYVEVYPMPHVVQDGRKIKRIMVMNEEGRLRDLPKNAMASAVYGNTGHIVGTVVVCPSRMFR